MRPLLDEQDVVFDKANNEKILNLIVSPKHSVALAIMGARIPTPKNKL